eukprot:3072520-Pyramimonas_sp.AAC.1
MGPPPAPPLGRGVEWETGLLGSGRIRGAYQVGPLARPGFCPSSGDPGMNHLQNGTDSGVARQPWRVQTVGVRAGFGVVRCFDV